MAKESNKTGTATWNPDEVKVTRQLTTSFRMEQDKPYLLQFLSAPFVDESRGKTEKDKNGKRKMEPPTMIRALDLTDGREVDLILATVPLRRIEEGWAPGEHLGACVRITRKSKREGRQYCDYDFDEIDGTGSPHYRDPAAVKKEAGKYGPRKVAAKK